MAGLDGLKKELEEEINLYGIPQNIRPVVRQLMKSSAEKGYRTACKEVKDILWPVQGKPPERNRWLWEMVELVDDLCIQKGCEKPEDPEID